jgi:CspA family cold shock protein
MTSLTYGVVREWHSDEGWGVIESPDTPDGAWVFVSAIHTEGPRSLTAGQHVWFTYKQAQHDGYDFRAELVQC